MAAPTHSPTQEPPLYSPAPSPSRRVSPGIWLGAAALVAVAALTIVLAATGSFGKSTTVNPAPTPAAATSAGGSGLNAAALYANANPGVVDITAQSTTTTSAGPFGQPRKAEQTDTGTGFVIDTKGNIVTADHVVAGASSVTVTFQNGATRTAKVLGGDTAADVAVLNVSTSGLTLYPLVLGSLSGHRIGDPLAVIGDPFDVPRSLSTGVISGLDRTIQAPNGFTIPHALQTDAAINPGNSGGPVFDASGRVVGIADQIATGGSGSDSSTGVGFAVPSDIIKSELPQLEAGVVPAHAFVGVSATDETDSNGNAGALVESVQPNGPAAGAGVKAGDLIVALGTAKIGGVNDLVAATATHKPGDRMTLTVIRGGKRTSLTITLAKQPTAVTSG
jgi:S1-C subfamily serine protease